MILLKVPILIGTLYLFNASKNVVFSAAMITIAYFFLGFATDQLLPLSFMYYIGNLFLFSLGYFALLDYLDNSILYWPVLLFGMLVLFC